MLGSHNMELAEENNAELPSAACRTLYDKEKIVSTAVHCNRLGHINEKSPKPSNTKTSDRRKCLSDAPTVQRNLVYIAGVPASLADEKTLERREYFGQYGEILKISVLKNESPKSQRSFGVRVYVTYVNDEDAKRCIQSVNGSFMDGKELKACFGTIEYCNVCPKRISCNNPYCLYLHDEGFQGDNYTEEQLLAKCGRKRVSEADWDNGRVESCGSDGDNFSTNSSGSRQASTWDSCKHLKFDDAKIKDEVSVFHDIETSSVESTSGLTVSGEAFTHTRTSVDVISHGFVLLADKIIRLDIIDPEFSMVQEKFYAGLGMLATFATVKGIYKDCHKSTSGQARLQAFRRQMEITRAARGDSNVRYAWHDTSKSGISVIVLHGFGQPRSPKNGALHGIGVYLTPEEYSHVSAVYSDVDENGEQHMVLCQVIMGNMEQVEQGSEQFHPTSEDYDTGVDDICNPRRYVVWSTHMNTHILPEYIVSFKLAPPWNDIISALRGKHLAGKPSLAGKGLQCDGHLAEHKSPPKTSCATFIPVPELLAKQRMEAKISSRAPRSPWMSFPMLFLVMKAKLSEAQMCELQQHYLQFKVGRMPRDELIKVVRSIAGDRLLADSIRSMQAQERANNSSSLAYKGNVAGEGRGACDN